MNGYRDVETGATFIPLRLQKQTITVYDVTGQARRVVNRMLWDMNQVYMGRLVYNKTAKHTGNGKQKWRPETERVGKDGAVPAIIKPAVFAEAEKLVKLGSFLHPRAIGSDYLLSGLVKCDRCGGSMTGYSISNGKHRWRYYRCWQGQDKGKTSCKGVNIRAEALENLVLENLLDLRTKPGKLRGLMKEQRVRERGGVGPLRQKVGRLEADLKKVAGREDQIKLAFEERAYSVAEMKERLARVAVDKERADGGGPGVGSGEVGLCHPGDLRPGARGPGLGYRDGSVRGIGI